MVAVLGAENRLARPADRALGCSRTWLHTKIDAFIDGRGRPLADRVRVGTP